MILAVIARLRQLCKLAVVEKSKLSMLELDAGNLRAAPQTRHVGLEHEERTKMSILTSTVTY